MNAWLLLVTFTLESKTGNMIQVALKIGYAYKRNHIGGCPASELI